MSRLIVNVAGKATTSGDVDGGRGSWIERAAVVDEWERQHEAEWVRVDQQLRGLAGRRAAMDAEEARLLRYAEELKLWRGWGSGGMLEYMERAMGYAPHTASERLRVARALGELPLLEEALERGAIAHSAIRELSRVAVPDTEAAWLEAAQGKCLREIEAMVSGHRPGDLPDDPTEPRLHRRTITLELSPESYDIWRKLHALAAEEHGQRLSDDELIPALFRRAYGAGPPGAAAPAATRAGAARAAAPAAIRAGAARAAASAATGAGPAGAAASAATGVGLAGAAASAATSSSNPACSSTTASSDVTYVASSVAGSIAAVSTSSIAAGFPDEVGAVSTAGEAGAPSGASASDTPAVFSASGSPPYQIAIKRCPDCNRGWQYTGGRDIEVDPAVLELAACDAVHLGSLDAAAPERTTTTVTPRKRQQVLARDGRCCTVPGCRRIMGLDLHHIEYQSHGGGHSLSNLTTLCDLHHRAVHFEKLVIRGTAPDQLTFTFRQPRDRRNVTDDDSPFHSATAGTTPPSEHFATAGTIPPSEHSSSMIHFVNTSIDRRFDGSSHRGHCSVQEPE